MPAALDYVVDLIFGRWRSQILYAGVALDVFAHLSPDTHRMAAAVAPKVRALARRLGYLAGGSHDPEGK